MLTNEERQRFAQYCEQEAESSDLIAQQLATLPGMDAMAKHERSIVVAHLMVAKRLRSVESVTINGQQSSQAGGDS